MIPSTTIGLLTFSILNIIIVWVDSLSPLWDSVTTNIYQEYDVQERNEVFTVRIDMGEYKSTDLVVGEDVRPDSRLILVCLAHHGPAEWVYSGDGNPHFTTNSTVDSSGKISNIENMNGAKRYIAVLTLGQKMLTTKDTGRYNCITGSPDSGMQFKTLSAYYHLYVPGRSKLFIRKSETIFYDLNKSAARIPCGVTNPLASVTLQKFDKGSLKFISPESMLYHPISGFYPKNDIQGVYLCTAAFNETFDFTHFNMLPMSNEKNQNKLQSSKRPNKSPNKITKPEDLEWLMYPSFTTRKPALHSLSTTGATRQPTKTGTKKTSYIPFHLRYSTTTYGPFQTFYGVQHDVSTNRPENEKYKIKTTIKTHPFNAAEYPPELFSDFMTTTTTSLMDFANGNSEDFESDNFKDEEKEPLPVSRPTIFNPLKDHKDHSSSNNNFQHPRPSLIHVNDKSKRTTSYPNKRRTTPRKYRPTPTTTLPIIIPENLVCAQFHCGINAVCFSSLVYNRTLKSIVAEPNCKCVPGYLGNAYFECYLLTEPKDTNVLFWSFGRVPSLQEQIYSEVLQNDTKSDVSESRNYSLEDENKNNRKSSIAIIDM